ncbi:RNA polymerase sigma-70 factor [Carboxylicivirga sp. A043]|uniref:RNA polymerase sigma-70 factor n=1 Tax=Carboxylicivirga litoralis TaxID=2816963 RepID=UPI0021CAFA14|nr:RNA polymerase sigma-70 factor [Carboxylicivirga sp. A043]MCU4156191.1 RNA polymerase sigma-70 factor [Carboxylicivirga sp. A043]
MKIHNQHINIELIRSGDEGAFEKVYKQYFSSLYFFAIQYVDKKSEAENLVQETFLSLWVNKESITGQSNNTIKSWLYTTLKNKCLNYLEKESNKRQYTNYQRQKHEADIDILGQMQISDVTFDEIEQLLHKALDEMPEQCRRVFELSRFNGLKNKEIALELNISIKAVEANMTRALKSLRIHLKDYLPLCILLGLI